MSKTCLEFSLRRYTNLETKRYASVPVSRPRFHVTSRGQRISMGCLLRTCRVADRIAVVTQVLTDVAHSPPPRSSDHVTPRRTTSRRTRPRLGTVVGKQHLFVTCSRVYQQIFAISGQNHRQKRPAFTRACTRNVARRRVAGRHGDGPVAGRLSETESQQAVCRRSR